MTYDLSGSGKGGSMAEKDYVIGIDCSTTATKAVLEQRLDALLGL
jgi:hypothetical protein